MSSFTRAVSIRPTPSPVRRMPTRICAIHNEDTSALSRLPIVFSGIAAAAVLTLGTPVEADVILQQPKLKSLNPETSAESKKAQAAKKSASSEGPGIEINLGFVSLPLTLAVCGGLYVAASKLDPEFDSFIEAAWLKDSNVNGIGYEEIYKSTDYTTGGSKRRS